MMQGINAAFRFEFVNLLNSSVPLPFRIDHNQRSGEGRIVLIDQLDYEIQTLYIFQVRKQILFIVSLDECKDTIYLCRSLQWK
jgi:hypothetical protein